MSAALISLIGPPAVGKTTTAELLAAELEARLIREDYAGNPFLSDFYLGQRELALAAQLYFLFSRITQLKLHTWPESGLAVSDYGFCQDAIYAGRSLSGEDLAVYRRLAGPASGLIKAPDLLIHLDGPEQMLLERIARRGRSYEATFTADFLRRMRRAYRDEAAGAVCPVIAVDIRRVNLREPAEQARLLREVREALP